MISVAIIIACLSNGQCTPHIGVEMNHGQCMATSQAMLADFHKKYPRYDMSKSRIMCAEPRRVQAILGRGQA